MKKDAITRLFMSMAVLLLLVDVSLNFVNVRVIHAQGHGYKLSKIQTDSVGRITNAEGTLVGFSCAGSSCYAVWK